MEGEPLDAQAKNLLSMVLSLNFDALKSLDFYPWPGEVPSGMLQSVWVAWDPGAGATEVYLGSLACRLRQLYSSLVCICVCECVVSP